MKKKLALLLACSMALSLTACGGGSKPAETTAAPETTTAAASEAAKEESKEDAAETTAAEAAGGDMDAPYRGSQGGRRTDGIRLLRGGISVCCLPEF